MPGGTINQAFIVPPGVATLTQALVQIDRSDVTAHMTVLVNGTPMAAADAGAADDTRFTFGPVGVRAGDQVTLQISFSATYGTIVTVYTLNDGAGGFSAANSCPAGGFNGSAGSQNLRAQVFGMTG
jgi:hypothetical protein